MSSTESHFCDSYRKALCLLPTPTQEPKIKQIKRRLVNAIRPGWSAVALLLGSMTPAFGQSTPVNYIGLNVTPITTSNSYNYNWANGTLTPGTASATVFSAAGVLQTRVADPTPPNPNGFGTFIGTARPVRNPAGHGAVLYEQSRCPTGVGTCFADGTFTFGYMVMYPMRGSTLDQLTDLETQYYVDDGDPGSNCFGGGSPRFSVVMSNGSEIHVYLGTSPNFDDCPAKNTWLATGNFATDAAGLRWDTSQICPGTFYNVYSGAIACADSAGLTINSIWVATDGGWFGTNQGPSPGQGQTFLFKDIKVNQVTRFPN